MNNAIRILLIDDADPARQNTRRVLSETTTTACNVDCASSYVEALTSLSQNAHDVCIIDCSEGRGLGLLAEACGVGCTMPIVFISSSEAGEAIKALRAGASDCLIRDELSGASLERSICVAIELARSAAQQDEFKRRYLALIENAEEIIYTHDLDGNYTSTNRAGQLLTGYSPEEAANLNVLDVVGPEYRDTVCRMIRHKVDEQKQTFYELEIVTKDGARLPVEVTTHLIFRDGRPIGVQGVARNITKRREAEAALRESEQRYRELFESSPQWS
jgi:PAS domain S-box-containing protein